MALFISCIKPILILFFVFTVQIGSYACTLGVAIGDATSGGRPMLWKTRDFEVKPNIIHYTETDTYSFISDITPEYGFNKSWFGLNNKGFAIANTYITDFPEGENGLGNGEFMNLALTECSTVDDFESLLDSTNITGRKTRAVFGVIDSCGGAVIFEVSSNKYWKYDANDKGVAPDGFIVRSNFVLCRNGNTGIERYNRSSVLIRDFHQKGNLNVKSILQTQMRDIAFPDGSSYSGSDLADSIVDCSKNICKYFSIAATVIQGVKQNEPAFLSTMWALLGNPFSSVAVPYWPVGAAPQVSASDSEKSLYGISQKLKDHIFESPQKKNNVTIQKVMELKYHLFEVEDSIYTATNKIMMEWRLQTPTDLEILEFENRHANYAYRELTNIYSLINKPIK